MAHKALSGSWNRRPSMFMCGFGDPKVVLPGLRVLAR